MFLYQPLKSYCFNSDSIFLYDFINSFNPRGEVLDVGAGSGVLGLLVARDNPKVNLEAVELQKSFAFYAQKNAEINSINYKLYNQSFLDFNISKKYDYIISNPPFYHDGVAKSDDEMRFKARYSVNLPFDQFVTKVKTLLKPKGHFIFCYDPQSFGMIAKVIEDAKMKIVDVRFVHSKEDRVASLVMVHARVNSSSYMRVLPPFISFDGDVFGKEAQNIYKKAKTTSIKAQL